MKADEIVDPQNIADILIAAGKTPQHFFSIWLNIFLPAGLHDSAALKKIAVEKLRKNKKILRDPAFKEKFKGLSVQDLLFEIIEEITK